MALPVFPSDSLGAGNPVTGLPLPASPASAALITATLPDACTVLRRTLTDDEAGGQVETFTPLGPYACRLMAETAPTDKTVAGGIHIQIAARLMELQLDADVLPGDHLTHLGREYVVRDATAPTGAKFLTVFLEWLGALAG